MSERLPVGDTLNEAFQFGLKRIVTVIRLGWAPMLLVIGMAVGFTRLVFDVSALKSSEDASVLLSPGPYLTMPPAVAILLGIGVLIIIMLLMAGFMASVYRLVALGEDRGGVFDLRFDGPSVRVFWAQLILALIGYGIFAIAFLIASAMTGNAPGEVFAAAVKFFAEVVSAAATGVEPDEQILMQLAGPLSVFFLAGLIALLPTVYANVRLAAFPAGSAAENRLLLLGAFDLSKGQFWSIFGVYFFLFLALMVFGFVYTILSSILELLASLGGAGGALAVIGVIFWVVQIAMMIFYQAFVLGVQLSMQAIIYRRLKTGA